MDPTQITEDELLARHRKERKEQQARIQALKKSADKGDKKRKREVLEEIAKLESALDKAHTEQLDELSKAIAAVTIVSVVEPNDNAADDATATTNEITGGGFISAAASTDRVSKAQKRRDKKAQADREKEAEILAQEELNKTGPRMQEIQALKTLLNARHLQLTTIASDGDCLYNAVRHQLASKRSQQHDVNTLRKMTADYIEANKDSLIFYMTNPSSGDILNDGEFERYCAAIRTTPAWGGQIELKALSNVLQVPIEVLQATGPPTVQNDGHFPGPPLVLTYHRFMYSLGEHYNSTAPLMVMNEDCN